MHWCMINHIDFRLIEYTAPLHSIGITKTTIFLLAEQLLRTSLILLCLQFRKYSQVQSKLVLTVWVCFLKCLISAFVDIQNDTDREKQWCVVYKYHFEDIEWLTWYVYHTSKPKGKERNTEWSRLQQNHIHNKNKENLNAAFLFFHEAISVLQIIFRKSMTAVKNTLYPWLYDISVRWTQTGDLEIKIAD